MSDLPHTLELLRLALGNDAVVTGADISQRHYSDWTGHSPACPAALLLPRTTADVASALRICNDAGQSVVPQGGMTGLAGG
ncbi:MAG: FAD-binding protein, partial [Pseudomonas gingeri]